MDNINIKDWSHIIKKSPIDLRNVTSYSNYASKAKSRSITNYLGSQKEIKKRKQHSEFVYKYAIQKFYKEDFDVLIDLGCTTGHWIKDGFNNGYIKNNKRVIAVDLYRPDDLPESVEFYQCNLNFFDETKGLFTELNIAKGTKILVTCVNLVERLDELVPVFRLIRDLLLVNNKQNRLILSSHDRILSRKDSEYNDVPPSESHVREWNLHELVSLIKSSGFRVHKAGYVPEKEDDDLCKVCLLEVSNRGFRRFVRKHFNNSYKRTHLILTNEHPKLSSISGTGGIGTFVSQMEKKVEDIIICMIQTEEGVFELAKENGWISPYHFFSHEQIKRISTGNCIEQGIGYDFAELSLRTVYHALLFFDIDQITSQNYFALSFRLIQAQKTGLIPKIYIRDVFHGGTLHRYNILKSFPSIPQIYMNYREVYCYNNCSELAFVSNFCKRVIRDVAGVERDDSTKIDIAYQYNPSNLENKFEKLERIVFLGKLGFIKGFDILLESLSYLIDHKILGFESEYPNIEFVAIGPYNTIFQHEEDRIAELLEDIHVKIKYTYLGKVENSKVLEYIQKNKGTSLFVTPYRGDNSPLVVYELMSHNCFFIAANAGGIPELIPKKFKKEILFNLNHVDLAQKIEQCLRKKPSEINEFLKEFSTEAKNFLDKRAESFVKLFEEKTKFVKENKQKTWRRPITEMKDDLTIVVPVYKMPFEYVKNTCAAINMQSYRPKEVIVVDDGNPAEYLIELEKVLHENLNVPYRLISQKNKGACEARNVGIRECNTEYIISLDSDNLPSNHSFYSFVKFLKNNPEYHCVTGYIKFFHLDSGQNPFLLQDIQYNQAYMPSVPNITMAFYSNSFGDTYACFRSKTLKETPGYEKYYRQGWDDWALYIYLHQRGYKLSVVPNVMLIYAVRKDSNHNLGEVNPELQYVRKLRLIRNFVSIPRVESYTLMALIDQIKNPQNYLGVTTIRRNFTPQALDNQFSPNQVSQDNDNQVADGQTLSDQALSNQNSDGQVIDSQTPNGQAVSDQVSQDNDNQVADGQTLSDQASSNQNSDGQFIDNQISSEQSVTDQVPSYQITANHTGQSTVTKEALKDQQFLGSLTFRIAYKTAYKVHKFANSSSLLKKSYSITKKMLKRIKSLLL